ncbi:pol protein [Cucumis melo var. makuwa]|uniref:Pol protein n=1 Tax=Cucumis melo var. makuwa TaxID=1194695 RepID=A0A5D3BQU8_CUCMM|nr:pol protein [Cucumis melo var. makuwa]TYK01142.1 pol protein [Cucumis melo var. makuwa]
MAPFEALYGKCCRSPVCWDEVGEQRLMGPELVQSTNESIQKIRAHMQTAQSRQKSYADVRRKDLKFYVGDKVFLKVALMKGVLRFEKKGKLSPCFIGPFEILERIGPVAYRLALPPLLLASFRLPSAAADLAHLSSPFPFNADQQLRISRSPAADGFGRKWPSSPRQTRPELPLPFLRTTPSLNYRHTPIFSFLVLVPPPLSSPRVSFIEA